jgi:hypothetical protein
MGIKKDETVLAGKGIKILPVETKITITNTQTGKEYADEKEALADVEDPATSTEEKHIKRDVAVMVNSSDIFGDTT